MTGPEPRSYRFAGHRLDTGSRTLVLPDGTSLAMTARTFDLLLHLIRNHDRVVGKDELLAAVWPGRVVEENSLPQAISALRHMLGTGAGDHRFIITVPGRGYRFVAALDAMDADGPDAAAPADGTITAAPEADRPPASRSWLRRVRWPALALALAVVAAGLVTTALREQPSRPASTPPVLVVLPFRTLGAGDAQGADAMLGLGMAETLITRLSRSTSLRVLSLGSVQQFAGNGPDPMRTAMNLGADYVVDGSAQRHGGSVRINARLVSLPDGHTVWAGTFDESPERVFTLQDALAEGMSSALSLQYPVAAQHRSPCDGSDAVAYRAYLRGRHLMFRPDRFHLPEAVRAFGEAIERDPLCARAWAGMAFAYRSMAITADRDPGEAFTMARAAVDKALAIDPDSAEAYASKGVIEFWYGWDWAAAEASLRRAIELNGNLAEAHYALAHLLNNLERHDEAEPHARNATLLDPLSPVINTIVASFFVNGGQYAEANRRLRKVLELNPDFWLALYMRGGIALERGNVAAAMPDLVRASTACGGCSHSRAVLVQAYAMAGDRAAAQRVLAAMEAQARDGYYPATQLALAHEALGEHARALDLLERAFVERDLYMSFLIVDKRLRGLYGQPRFEALRERMNLPPPRP